MTRHHAAIILTAVIVGSLSWSMLRDHQTPPQASWFELLLAGLQVMETA